MEGFADDETWEDLEAWDLAGVEEVEDVGSLAGLEEVEDVGGLAGLGDLEGLGGCIMAISSSSDSCGSGTDGAMPLSKKWLTALN